MKTWVEIPAIAALALSGGVCAVANEVGQSHLMHEDFTEQMMRGAMMGEGS